MISSINDLLYDQIKHVGLHDWHELRILEGLKGSYEHMRRWYVH